MRASEASLWKFSHPITDDSVIRCQDCKEFSPIAEWREGEAGCEDCGSHAAMICPRCGGFIDHVWASEFIVHQGEAK